MSECQRPWHSCLALVAAIALASGLLQPVYLGAAITPQLVEPAPTNLTAGVFQRGFDEIVTLRWQDNSSNEYSFRIQRCRGQYCTNFQWIATTAPNATSYRDYFQFTHGYFRYRVRAHGPYGYSAWSNIRTVHF